MLAPAMPANRARPGKRSRQVIESATSSISGWVALLSCRTYCGASGSKGGPNRTVPSGILRRITACFADQNGASDARSRAASTASTSAFEAVSLLGLSLTIM